MANVAKAKPAQHNNAQEEERTVDLTVPLSFSVRMRGDTILGVTSNGPGKAIMLAQANVAPRSGLAADICAALGVSGAMVTGNVNVFIPRSKAPPEVIAKADARRAALDNDAPKVRTPGAAGSLAFKVG